MCLFTCTLFLLVSTFLPSLLSVFVGLHFNTADWPGPHHWPLVPGGLVVRIQHTHCSSPTSVSGQQLKPCFNLLQSEAT